MAFKQGFRRTFLLPARATSPFLHKRALSSLAMLNGTATGVARLKSVNLSRLRSRVPEEIEELRTACEDDGFFYLDLRNVDNGRMLRDWASIQSLMGPWFNQDLDEKMKYYCGTVLHGYTPVGTYAGLAEGTRDGNESIKITDVARRASPAVLPSLYLENRHLLDRFKDGCRAVSMDLIGCLSDSLGLEGLSRLEQYHRSYMPTNTCLNLFCYPKSDNKNQFGQIKHTDTGTLTLLFSSHPGLEILSPKSRSWGSVEPIDGHVVVNVGDTLRYLSNKRFYSSIHRASPLFKDSQQQRLVVGYFFRADNDAVVRDSEGNIMTVSQWHDQKYNTYKTPHSAERPDTVLTGGMDGCLEQNA